jgi:uncharacterized surface protein with fasciclin (FAS1) repeats
VLTKNADPLKLRRTRLSTRLITLFLLVTASALLSTACSDGDSGTGAPAGGGASGDQAKTFESVPIEPGSEVPKGLNDTSGDALIAVLQSDPRFSDYVKLLQLSDVAGDLATRDSLTVFAPVNQAVSKQAGLLDAYLAPEDLESALASLEGGTVPSIDDPDRLAALLRRGIVNGEVPPASIKAGLELSSLEGKNLRLTGSPGAFSVDGVRFDSQAGTLAANGILYPASGLVRP